jgi:hypothetical protein
MTKRGRPKLPPDERRETASLNVRFNKAEWDQAEQKARAARQTPTQWARYAAIERDPPAPIIIPELNRKAWRELARLAATLNGAMWRFRPGAEESLRALFEAVRRELAEVRSLLVEGKK